MAEKDKQRKEKENVGPAYTARYAKLGRIDFRDPSRRLIMGIGLAAICVLIVLVLLAG